MKCDGFKKLFLTKLIWLKLLTYKKMEPIIEVSAQLQCSQRFGHFPIIKKKISTTRFTIMKNSIIISEKKLTATVIAIIIFYKKLLFYHLVYHTTQSIIPKSFNSAIFHMDWAERFVTRTLQNK